MKKKKIVSFKSFLNQRVLSIKSLAKKHNVSEEEIDKALRKGVRVEHEHTTKIDVARRIALAHLAEDPKYYDKLRKMEKK